MQSSVLSAAVLVALFCPALVIANSATVLPDDGEQPPSAQELDVVYVTGYRLVAQPADSHRESAQTLRPQVAANNDTAQLLSHLPGVALQTGGGVSSMPSIHGLGADRNRISVDGMDFLAACPNNMNPPLSYIAPSNVGEIRVYAGITPVSAGGDSIGGSIQVQSARPEFADADEGWQLTGAGGIGWRSNGNVRNADIAVNLADEVFSLRADASVARAGNYQAAGDFRNFTASGREGHDIPRDEVASSSYDVRNQSVRAAALLGTHLVQANISRQQIPLQGYPNQRMEMSANTLNRWQLSWENMHDWGDWQVRVWREQLRHSMAYGRDRQYWYGVDAVVPGVSEFTRPCGPLSYTCAAEMPMETQSRTSAATFTANISLRERDVLRVGGEWHDYQLNDWWPPSGSMMWPDAFWNIRDGKRQRASVFAEWEGYVSPQFTVLAGLRYTRVHTNAGAVQGYDNDVTPPGSYMMTARDVAAFNAQERARTDHHLDATALLRYSVNAHFDIDLGLAQKTRSPNLYERYAWSTWAMAAVMNNTVGDGNGYVGSIGLKPERARTLAMSIDWHDSGANKDWQVRVTPWITQIDDYIDAVAITNNGANAFNILRQTNQSARLHGVDVLADVHLGENALGHWRMAASGNWQRGSNRDTHAPLYNVMPPNLRLQLQHHTQRWDNRLEVEGVAAKTRVNPVRNELPTHGYGLLHLRSSYQFASGLRVDAGVENALNRLYTLPLGGAYVAQGRTMAINGIPHGIGVPGVGRSVYVAVRWVQ